MSMTSRDTANAGSAVHSMRAEADLRLAAALERERLHRLEFAREVGRLRTNSVDARAAEYGFFSDSNLLAEATTGFGNLGRGAASAVNKWLLDLGMADHLDRAYDRQKAGLPVESSFVGNRASCHSMDSEDEMLARRAQASFAMLGGGDHRHDQSNGSVDFIAGCLFCMAVYAVVQLLIMFEGVFVPFMVAIFLMYLLDPIVRFLVLPRDLALIGKFIVKICPSCCTSWMAACFGCGNSRSRRTSHHHRHRENSRKGRPQEGNRGRRNNSNVRRRITPSQNQSQSQSQGRALPPLPKLCIPSEIRSPITPCVTPANANTPTSNTTTPASVVKGAGAGQMIYSMKDLAGGAGSGSDKSRGSSSSSGVGSSSSMASSGAVEPLLAARQRADEQGQAQQQQQQQQQPLAQSDAHSYMVRVTVRASDGEEKTGEGDGAGDGRGGRGGGDAEEEDEDGTEKLLNESLRTPGEDVGVEYFDRRRDSKERRSGMDPRFSMDSGRGADCSLGTQGGLSDCSGSDIMSPLLRQQQEEEDKRLEELLQQHRADTAFYTDKNLPIYRQVRCPRILAVIVALLTACVMFWGVGYMISQEVRTLESRFQGQRLVSEGWQVPEQEYARTPTPPPACQSLVWSTHPGSQEQHASSAPTASRPPPPPPSPPPPTPVRASRVETLLDVSMADHIHTDTIAGNAVSLLADSWGLSEISDPAADLHSLAAAEGNGTESHPCSPYKAGFIMLRNWTETHIAQKYGVKLDDLQDSIISMAKHTIVPMILSSLEDIVVQGAVTIIFLLYMMGSPMATGVSKQSLAYSVDQNVRMYIKLKAVINILAGATCGAIWSAFDLDLAWLFGLFTAVLNFIPNIGSVVATLLPIPLILLDARLGWMSKLLCLILPFTAHNIIGNYVEPKLFGRSLDLHPIVVLLSMSLWASVWGVAGAILSVPLVAVLRVLVMHVDHDYARIALIWLEGDLFSVVKNRMPERRKFSRSRSRGRGRRKKPASKRRSWTRRWSSGGEELEEDLAASNAMIKKERQRKAQTKAD